MSNREQEADQNLLKFRADQNLLKFKKMNDDGLFQAIPNQSEDEESEPILMLTSPPEYAQR